jgi:hypothetical protein
MGERERERSNVKNIIYIYIKISYIVYLFLLSNIDYILLVI